jgi:hypothetical protein
MSDSAVSLAVVLWTRRNEGFTLVVLHPRSFTDGRFDMELQTMNDTVIATRGRVYGFTLLQRELDTGQLVWTWTNPNDATEPRFLTRRQALAYMDDWLRRRARRRAPGTDRWATRPTASRT